MNLRQIEVFRAFMLTGTIGDAAKLLGVSQPAVSSMLHHVQSRSGIRLFEPIKGRLLPTAEALILFAEIQLTWKSVERIQQLCEDLARGRSGALRIAASTSLGTHVVPTLVKSLEKDYPKLSVSMELFTPSLLVECLIGGFADVGVASYDVDHPGVLTKKVGATPIVCVTPRGHALAAKPAVTIQDLAPFELVTHSLEMPEGTLIADTFMSAGIVPRSRIQVRSGQSACWFVRSGAGVALVDAMTVAGKAFPDLVTRPLDPPLSLPIITLRSPARSLSKAALAFAQSIETYCKREFPIRAA